MATETITMPAPPPAAETKPRSSVLEEILGEQARVASRYKPVMSLDEYIEREKILDYLVDKVMREGVDFGWVPGTKPSADPKPGEYVAKPTLFKAGAERACAFFGYVPSYDAIQTIEEWTRERFGEMLFFYEYRCTLEKDGKAVGQGIGSATTWESKYRYRNAERVCPQCGAANIRKSKPKPNQRQEPGFYCWEKTGGCGGTFAADDPAITSQELGKVPNPDIADMVNVVQKMGQKRSYVAATLTATGLSGRFTQDLEDMKLPHPAETQDEVRDRRIAEEQAKQNHQANGGAGQGQKNSPAAPPPAELSEAQSLEQAFIRGDRFERLKIFGNLKARLVKACGSEEAGHDTYYTVLGRFDVGKANEFKGAKTALECMRAMVAEVQQREAAPAPAQDPMEISDDDLPREMFGEDPTNA